MTLKEQIASESRELCQLFGIRRLSLFGSVARGDEEADSDIEFIAEFESPSPESMPDRYFGFLEEASKRFKREVQLVTPAMVQNPHLKRSIQRDLTILHERNLA